MSNGDKWLQNHTVTELWSGPGEGSIAFTSVPQWSIFQQLADQRGSRILVHYFGNSVSQAGDLWVDADDLGPIDPPTQLPPAEPEWAPPEPSATKWLQNHTATELWSSPDEGAIAFTLVPQWSIFQQLGDQQGPRVPVHYFGNSVSQAGDVWVDADDLGPIDPPAQVPPAEPDPPAPPAGRFTPEQIAQVIGCPVQNAETHWPALARALEEQGIADRATAIATIATIGVEVGSFRPIHEYGGPEYWSRYEWNPDLGNTQPGDGVNYHGRGFIQLTGRSNYRNYGRMLGLPLEDNPDLALEPDTAARIFALYFQQRRINECAAQGDWREVRRRVNGGYNGWGDFISFVSSLETLAEARGAARRGARGASRDGARGTGRGGARGAARGGGRPATKPRPPWKPARAMKPRRRPEPAAARGAGMMVGACWPYLDQHLAPGETWDVFWQMGAQCVRICSNAAREDVAALQQHAPWLRWIVRTRDPKADTGTGPFRPGLLWYKAWDSEPTLFDTLTQLLSSGAAVDVELLNEPDIEWDEQAGWGPAEIWERAASDCRQYLEWQLNEIRNNFPNQGGLRLVGPALSEGWPERHDVWLNIMEPLYWQFDALAVHAYTNGQAFDDPNWGGRPLIYRDRFPGKPLLLTEVNDNGHAGISDPSQRGAEIGQYLAWLGGQGAVELACLFALPGQTVGVQDWWGWSPDMVGSLQGQLQFA